MKRPNIPNVIDFEASGFGSCSYPIEVGVILSSGDRYCSLIRPLPEWTHWNPAAEALHGISRAQLVTAGKEIGLVARELNAILAQCRVYSDAWSVDKPWLICLYTAAAIEPSFELSPIEAIQTEAQQLRWGNIYQSLAAEMPSCRHRASSDALLVQATYMRSRDQ